MSSAPDAAAAQLAASVGGPWGDFVSRSDASMAKLLQESLPKTKATRASWLANHQELDDDDRVDRVQFVDLYTSFVLLLLLPIAVVAYVVVGLGAMPALLILQIYKTTALKRPAKSIERTLGFHLLALLIGIEALPCLVFVLVYWLGAFTIIFLFSLLYSLASLKILLLRDNLALTQSCSRWPKWSWNDTVCALLGTMDRQGFVKFALKFPSALRCLWTSPLDFNDQKAVAAVVQAASWTLVNLTDLLPQQVSQPPRKDDRIVSGHIPFPAPDRVSGTVIGVLTTNSLVTLVNADHNVNGSIFHSMTAKRSIYNVLLFVWNPCHYLTGYIEINLQHEGGIEQARDNYLGHVLFERTDALFWHYDPIKRGQTQPCSLRFIRGSIASTTSADSATLDRDNNDDRRPVTDIEASRDSYGTREGIGSFESALSHGSIGSEQEEDVNDCSHRVNIGIFSSFKSSQEIVNISEERSTMDSVAMLQSDFSSTSQSDFTVSDQRPERFYIM
ncbi:hypothetical protein PInf_004817 [Phytophthora infestans]|nr:hypothetical protein PInf_004817 [Phytophthora infestans]